VRRANCWAEKGKEENVFFSIGSESDPEIKRNGLDAANNMAQKEEKKREKRIVSYHKRRRGRGGKKASPHNSCSRAGGLAEGRPRIPFFFGEEEGKSRRIFLRPRKGRKEILTLRRHVELNQRIPSAGKEEASRGRRGREIFIILLACYGKLEGKKEYRCL